MVKLIQRIDQKQNLSPQQILEANVLQLTLSALEKKIYEEIESNPVLEINEDNDLNENDDADNERFYSMLKDPHTWERTLLTLALGYDITDYAKLKLDQ